MQPNRTAIWAQQHEADIRSLRKLLQDKDKEIADLRQNLKEIQENNNDLQIKLKTKDDEVNALKERIQTLEDEKNDLQEELSRVEAKVKRLENDTKNLTKTSKLHEEENRKLKEDLQKVEYRLKTAETNLTTVNEKLTEELRQLKAEARLLPAVMDQARFPIQASEQSMAMLHLGELCWQIQGSMYKKVLPKYYTPLRSYKVKSIEKDVRKLVKEEDERKEATDRWKMLKSKLNWNDEFEEALRSLQDSRNIEAHPMLNETELKLHAMVLEKEGILKGWLSLERVNGLIDIWKGLQTGQC
ncbi:hypothetical protein QZH41_001250 [Actinostola sp. cb2023]|nr:hypothetical protein QZH41_001250 [Actinostola sp. cb2023]